MKRIFAMVLLILIVAATLSLAAGTSFGQGKETACGSGGIESKAGGVVAKGQGKAPFCTTP